LILTLTWQCLSNGPITFFMLSNMSTQSPQTQSCGTGGGSLSLAQGLQIQGCNAGSCVNLTANPNVVSCKGGSTTVTAFTEFHLPNWVPATPVNAGPNGLPAAQQPYFFFAVSKGVALVQQTSNNTAVVTLLEGVPEAEITATSGTTTGTIRITPYCRPGTAAAASAAAAAAASAPAVSGTPGVPTAPIVSGTPVAPPLPIGALTITASPGTIETCDGSVFLSATVKDSNGKLVPDGTNVLFIATRGILDPASANTVLGTANVVYTSDLKTAGSVKLSAQSGAAFASVDVPVLCGASGSLSGSAAGRLGTPTAGSPSFTPPNTGQGFSPSITIRPPSTGDAGLKISGGEQWEERSLSAPCASAAGLVEAWQ